MEIDPVHRLLTSANDPEDITKNLVCLDNLIIVWSAF